jgi:hypothetical protein
VIRRTVSTESSERAVSLIDLPGSRRRSPLQANEKMRNQIAAVNSLHDENNRISAVAIAV